MLSLFCNINFYTKKFEFYYKISDKIFGSNNFIKPFSKKFEIFQKFY